MLCIVLLFGEHELGPMPRCSVRFQGELCMKCATNRMKAVFVLLALGAGLTLSACNTVEGVGKDIEATGDAISDTASDAKD